LHFLTEKDSGTLHSPPAFKECIVKRDGFLKFMQRFHSLSLLGLRRGFCHLAVLVGLTHAPITARSQDVVIGQLASVTSPVTQMLAQEYHDGLALAIQHVNAAGGVQGRRVRLQLMDDGFNPDRTAVMAQELVDKHGAVALVGGMGTGTLMRLIKDKFMEKNRIGNFAPLTGLAEAQAAPDVFPVRATFDDEVKAMFAHAASLGRKKVAFVYYQAGAGPAMSKLAPQWASAAGLELTANAGFAVEADPAKQRSAVDGMVAGLGATQPDAVVLVAVGASHAAAVKALRQRHGVWLPVYSLGQVNLQDLVAEAGTQGARGVCLTQVMPSPGSVDKLITREFAADRLRWKPEMTPSYVSLEGYVAGRVLAEVMQRAKALTREGFRVRYQPDARKSLQPVDVTIIDRDGHLRH
jgi:branched-chain amino acid transport system substrate-binding protein